MELEKRKEVLQKSIGNIFKMVDEIKCSENFKNRFDRIYYKRDVYTGFENTKYTLEDYEYSDLLGCMLDIEEDVETMVDTLENILSIIQLTKKEIYEKELYEDLYYERESEEDEE